MFVQVLPVDLTRSIDPKSDDVVVTSQTSAAQRKLAFSVENILDPTKFTGRKEGCDNDRNNNERPMFAAAYGAGLRNDEELSQAGKCYPFLLHTSNASFRAICK